jgi:hypothetical protein
MSAFLSALLGLGRSATRHRVADSLTDFDDHTLRDIGLLRSDVHASLIRPRHRPPEYRVKLACCPWIALGNPVRPTGAPVPCC